MHARDRGQALREASGYTSGPPHHLPSPQQASFGNAHSSNASGLQHPIPKIFNMHQSSHRFLDTEDEAVLYVQGSAHCAVGALSCDALLHARPSTCKCQNPALQTFPESPETQSSRSYCRTEAPILYQPLLLSWGWLGIVQPLRLLTRRQLQMTGTWSKIVLMN